MSREKETYCRLCAEPMPVNQLVSPDEGVVFNSSVITKLSWINIDITGPNGLPNTICFSCLALLERTWTFLNNVRKAQEKLKAIFVDQSRPNKIRSTVDIEDKDAIIPGKPVDQNWENFVTPKIEIKIEDPSEQTDLHRNSSIPDEISADNVIVKTENDNIYDDFIGSHNGFISSSDSDSPLKKTVKKKKAGRKRKRDVNKIQTNNTEVPTGILSLDVSWDDQACRCGKCDATCKSILSLQLHSFEVHNQCCLFKCVDCDKVSNTYKSFVRHLRSHNTSLRQCCEYCNKIFEEDAAVHRHKTKDHKDIYNTKCKNCGTTFKTADELKEHRSIFSKDSKKSTKRIQILNGESSNYKCTQCNKVFKNRQNLYQHIVLHSERSRNFACHVCGKMYYTKGSLSAHMVIHEDAKKFKCDHCPRAFHAKGNLISHLSLHTGLKPFICEQCGKSFRIKRHLISHSIMHTDLRPYVCEYCNKTFRFKTRLNLHIRQHTGVRPYKCEFCQRDFTNGSNHKKHMLRRHGIDTSTRNNYNIVNKDTLNNDSIATAQLPTSPIKVLN